jgi:hypothetical protein
MNKSFISLVAAALFLISLISFQPVTVNAQTATLIVPDQYSNIQDAIDHASNGSTVFVKSGIYYLDEMLIVNKPISLIGEDKQNTILRPNYIGHEDGSLPIILLLSDNMSVSHFTIDGNGNPLTNNLIGIKILNDSALSSTVPNPPFSCKITDNNIINLEDGIFDYGGTIEISGNNITNNQCGIYNFAQHQYDVMSIKNNSISYNQGGIEFFFINPNAGTQIVKNNLIVHNVVGIGIGSLESLWGGCNIRDNTIAENTIGIDFDTGHGFGSSMLVHENNLLGNTQYNVKANFPVDCKENWWGTTDVQAINKTIYGAASFLPYLGALNTDAPAYTISTIPELSWLVILPLTAAAFTLISSKHFRRLSSNQKT